MPVIVARCQNGHTQEIRIAKELGWHWAQIQAALLDGSSGFYVSDPRQTDSVIGKCGICRAQIECSVVEES